MRNNRLDEIITLVVRETGWSLEYVQQMPFAILCKLVEELDYQKKLDDYKTASYFAMVIATYLNAHTKDRKFKIKDFIGDPPQRRKEGGISLAHKTGATIVKLGDGQEYEFVPLNANMMAEVEEHFDMSFDKMFGGDQRRTKYTRYLLWTILKAKYPDITEEQVGEILTAKVIAEAFPKIFEHIME